MQYRRASVFTIPIDFGLRGSEGITTKTLEPANDP